MPPPSGSSGGLSGQSLLNDSRQALQVGSDVFNVANGLGLSLVSPEWTMSLALPLAGIAAGVDFLVNFFEDLFGGSESPPTPRQLLHGRHPLYPFILGVSESLIATMESEGPKICYDGPQPCTTPPLQKQPNKQKELCEQAALTHLEKCIGESSALIIGAASLPCEATVLAGPEILATCEGIMETLAIPPLVGAAGACISQYKDEVSRCGP